MVLERSEYVLGRPVNGSEIADYLACRARWLIKWHLNRVPRVPEAKPLTFGKAFHQMMETHFRDGLPLLDCAMNALSEAERVGAADGETLAQIRTEFGDLMEVLQGWQDHYPITRTLEVEEPFEIMLAPGIPFRGRPDRVVECFGKVWHMQHKALAASKNIGQYLELAKRSLHENLYAVALTEKYGGGRGVMTPGAERLEYGGTIFNILRKLKYRSKPTKTQILKAVGDGRLTEADVDNPAAVRRLGTIQHTPAEIMSQTSVPVRDELMIEALTDVITLVRDMAKDVMIWENEKRLPPSSRALDAGYFGNSIDPYFRLLLGDVTLDDNELFMDRIDTYDTPPVET